MVTPTGNATTTVVNKTTVPFNQTMVTGGSNQSQNNNKLAMQQHQDTTSNTSGGGQANQSQEQGNGNPIEQHSRPRKALRWQVTRKENKLGSYKTNPFIF